MARSIAYGSGKESEEFVAAELQQRGWLILARNKRTPYAEVDLFALPPPIGTALVLVEVKARHPLSWNQEELALGWKQRRRLARALVLEAAELRWQNEIRADLALVRLDGGRPVELEILVGVDLLD